MKFTFTLDEDDFLTNLLFTASKSETIKKRRQKTRILVPGIYILFGFFCFQDQKGLGIAFIVFGILWILFYPKREKSRYINYYKKYVKDNFSERIGRACTFEVDADFLLLNEGGTESKVQISDVESIYEISSAFIIKLKLGTALLMPKAKIINSNDLKNALLELATKANVPYTEELDWVWK